jgi:DNA-binding MarR family transcriptional regulator
MHTLFFSLKRAQHSTLRLSRPLLAKMGLTAARFDLLHPLRRHRNYGLRQSSLQRMLGVSRATVSRMVRSLEDLGLVRRERDTQDYRQKRVLLTELGFERVRLAFRRLVRSGWVQLAIDSTLGADRLDGAYPGPCYGEIGQLDRHLRSLRRHLRDTGCLRYLLTDPL